MSDLKIPKRRTSVELQLLGGQARGVDVFLAEFASGHAGPERLSDILNGKDGFFPGLDVASNAMTFVHRDAVLVARVPHAVESLLEQHTIPTEHEVEISLTDGTRLTGLIAYARPSDRDRLSDFLNEPEPFFALLEEQHVALVNKRHVARVANVNR